MVSFTLWLVRHGQTLYNKKNIVQGQLDVPLSDVGLEQAKKVGLHLRLQKFTHVYSSDLMRARQTAEEIVKCNVETNCPIVTDVRLRERKFGDWEGKSNSILKQSAAEMGKSIAEFCPPGGETLKQLYNRSVLFFTELCRIMRTKGDSNRNFCENLTSKAESCSDHDNQDIVDVPSKTSDSIVACENYNGDKSSENLNCSESSGILSSSPKESSSSLESNQKHSCADGEQLTSRGIPANILLVSHGGFLKELIHHLFTDLSCQYEGKKVMAKCLPSNASISKFLITLDTDEQLPTVSCLQLHYRDHLDPTVESASMSGDPSKNDDIAL